MKKGLLVSTFSRKINPIFYSDYSCLALERKPFSTTPDWFSLMKLMEQTFLGMLPNAQRQCLEKFLLHFAQ